MFPFLQIPPRRSMRIRIQVLALFVLLLAFGTPLPEARSAEHMTTETNRLAEITFTSQKERTDPFNEIDLDVVFTGPAGEHLRVPAYWAGGRLWRVRFASPTTGVYHYRSECSDPSDKGLHGVHGSVEIRPYRGDNPLYRHGPLRVASDRRHFAYHDGTPFFWLGDTWWMGLCERLHRPDEFRALAADRK